ncbi:MAG: hypothetical protein ABI977_09105 [Acidobacteriota bacterium]
MRLTKEELSQFYQQQTTRPAQWAADCPTAAQMARAATGEMDEAERAGFADHLIACSDCAGEYRELRVLKPWVARVAANAAGPVPRIETVEALAANKQTLQSPALKTGERDEVQPSLWGRFGAGLRLPALAYAMGAAVLVSGLLIGWWALSLRSENQRLAAQVNEQRGVQEKLATAEQSLAEARRKSEEDARRSAQSETQVAELQNTIKQFSQPQLNVRIIDLEPRAGNRGEPGGAAKLVVLPAGASLFTCVLNVTGQPSFSNYALEITDQQGQMVWRGEGLHKSPDNTFTVVLPSRLLPTGKYHLKLYGLRQQQPKLIEAYALQLQYK